MTWNHLLALAVATSMFVLAGCSTTADTDSPGMASGTTVEAPTAAPEVELVGMPGLDEPIPARSVDLTALGLSCPLCAHNLDKQLLRIDGVEAVQVDLSNGVARIDFEDTGCVTPRQLIDAVEASGFSVTRVEAIHERLSTTEEGTSDARK